MDEPSTYSHPTDRGPLWIIRKADGWAVMLGSDTLGAGFTTPWRAATAASIGLTIPSGGTTAGLASDDLSDWRGRP